MLYAIAFGSWAVLFPVYVVCHYKMGQFNGRNNLSAKLRKIDNRNKGTTFGKLF